MTTTVITRTTARIVVPIVLVVAISLFLQGHNDPGGGFIGGVLTVAAFALIYVAYDLDYLDSTVLDREIESGTGIYEHRSVLTYRRLFGVGLVVLAISAAGPLLLGDPLLAQDYTYLHTLLPFEGFEHGIPLFGEVELASALLFDIGVYCIVVGGLLSILSVVSAE